MFKARTVIREFILRQFLNQLPFLLEVLLFIAHLLRIWFCGSFEIGVRDPHFTPVCYQGNSNNIDETGENICSLVALFNSDPIKVR